MVWIGIYGQFNNVFDVMNKFFEIVISIFNIFLVLHVRVFVFYLIFYYDKIEAVFHLMDTFYGPDQDHNSFFFFYNQSRP